MRAVFGEDLVVEILLRIPCKSMMRFKCVSKGWYALINCPWFIAKHLSFLNSKLSNLLIMRNTLKDGESEYYEDGEEVEVAFSLLNLCNNDDESIESGEDRIIVSSVEDIELPLSLKTITKGWRGYMIGHCNGIICLCLSQLLLWNPAIQDFKLVPESSLSEGLVDLYGFGYDAKSNDYKLVCIELGPFLGFDAYGNITNICPKAGMYSLSTDSWKEINTNGLETETTFFWPDSFEIQFKQMFCWLGQERLKDLHMWSDADLYVRQVIILLDIENEVFYETMIPDWFYEGSRFSKHLTLRVWNESLALFGLVGELHEDFLTSGKTEYYFIIWVMDELGGRKGASWTKLVTLKPTEKPLGFFNSNGIPLNDFMKLVCSYDLGSKRIEEETFRQNSHYTIRYDFSAVGYVKSIVRVSGAHKLEIEIKDHSSVANLPSPSYFASIPSIADREWHSYSIWVIPPHDVSLRIKKVMESLRAEFGGPEIEPHIPIVASIRMTYENVLEKFRSLSSENFRSFHAIFNLLDSNDFYYQCLSLVIDTSNFEEFGNMIVGTSLSFGVDGYTYARKPRLSLLYGKLTEEERKVAVEKVGMLDESISNLRFTVTQLALYRINYRDATLKSWEKIAVHNFPLP